MNFIVKESSLIYSGKVFDIKVDNIEYFSGNPGIREVVHHPGGAVAVPLTKENTLLLVKQFRYPLQKSIIEFPAGKLEKGEDPFLCAQRELLEETGMYSDNINELGKIYTTPGFCDEILYIYLAKDLIQKEHNREEGEFGMEIIELSLKEMETKILSGEINDAKTLCAFQFLNMFLHNK